MQQKPNGYEYIIESRKKIGNVVVGTEILDRKQNGRQIKLQGFYLKEHCFSKTDVNTLVKSIHKNSNQPKDDLKHSFFHSIGNTIVPKCRICMDITILQTTPCSYLLIVLHQSLMLAFHNWYMIRCNETNTASSVHDSPYLTKLQWLLVHPVLQLQWFMRSKDFGIWSKSLRIEK